MPTSAAIAALVLGGIFLLLALVGGPFELFGAEVPAAASRASRWIAGVLGLALLVFGITLSVPAESAAQRDPGPPGAAPARDSRDDSLAHVLAIKDAITEAEDASWRAMMTGDPVGLERFLEGQALTSNLEEIRVAAQRRASIGVREEFAIDGLAFDSVVVSGDRTRAEAHVRLALSGRMYDAERCVRFELPPVSASVHLRRLDHRWIVYRIMGDATPQPDVGSVAPRPC